MDTPTTAPAEDTSTQEATPQTPATPAPATPAPADTTPEQAPTQPQSVADLPEWAQKEIHDARREAAASRTKAKTAADDAKTTLAQQIGKALGIITDDQPAPTVEDLTGQVQASQAETRAARTEVAVYKAAHTLNADPTALLDSRSFLASLEDVDPTDSTAVADAIKTAVANNPRLALAPAAGATSIDRPGQTHTTVTQEQFNAMTYSQRDELLTNDPATYRALAANI
ncbi:hypothetical protein [Actinomyces urogenitalis]|uniref:hypothetical protein n=1 Tax=Actinomyces urogenitalis TaxID=103621 RepID=UPI0029025239|nr:hypothetical protein [Actinomyces urogenitalis]MDU0864424.1 hypothetical protein [Actinomyces urogenitalis]MDU0874970.1 hypothetical protein [Actinomyces urogenitalis]MDU1565359.1 hypothetical protein [Actinomyces urogenitalis]MDU1640602.1 hypothetical protein [Actinomyces urogenitalis]MDU6777776.1 hypothetical protein [Actinomyces urogenitalis]